MNLSRWYGAVSATIVACNLAFLVGSASAQKVVTKSVESAEAATPFVIAETGAIVMPEDGKIMISIVLPPENRPKEYAEVDMAEGDEIIMLNGKRITTVEQLQELYESLPPGDKVQLGVRRDKAMRIVTFAKGDPEKLPQPKLMVMTAPEDGEIPAMQPIPELGVLLADVDEQATVYELIPMNEELRSRLHLEKGAVIKELQNEPVASAESFAEAFRNIKAGAEVTLTSVLNGEQHLETFVKPESPAGQIKMAVPK